MANTKLVLCLAGSTLRYKALQERERERDVRVRVDDHHKRVTLDPSREEDEWIN